jgi:hypothetical protein
MTTDAKRESQDPVCPHHSPDRIEEEHHTLREQLDVIAAATTCTALFTNAAIVVVAVARSSL